MTMKFLSLIFIWLLPLKANSTFGQNENFTTVITGNKLTHDQPTTQEASSLHPISEPLGQNITASMKVDVNAIGDKTTKPSTEPSLQTTQATSFKTSLPNIQRASTPTSFTSSQFNSSTEVQFKVTTSIPMAVTNQATNSTTTARLPTMLMSSTQRQDTTATLTPSFNGDKTTQLSARPTPPEKIFSTMTISTKPVENKSTSAGPVTGGDATQSTGISKTSLSTTKGPVIPITEANKRQDSQDQKKNTKSQNGTNHSKAVAGVIGGALVLMMIGFLVIYIKKRKLQKQQMSTSDWAGPSPFLEGGADNGKVTMRSSNRISLSSFLPQRLSKRLSLLPEIDEELQEITPGTTFGDKHQESMCGREVDGNDAQESNGTAVVVPQMKSTGEAHDNVENPVSASSSQTNNLLVTNNNSEVTNFSGDYPAKSQTQSGDSGEHSDTTEAAATLSELPQTPPMHPL